MNEIHFNLIEDKAADMYIINYIVGKIYSIIKVNVKDKDIVLAK